MFVLTDADFAAQLKIGDHCHQHGIKFINAYAAGPLCTPTRTAFITGRYPAKTPVGLIEPLTGEKKDTAFGLTTEYPSLATLMKTGGYETALIGKWHLGFLPQHSPVKNGCLRRCVIV